MDGQGSNRPEEYSEEAFDKLYPVDPELAQLPVRYDLIAGEGDYYWSDAGGQDTIGHNRLDYEYTDEQRQRSIGQVALQIKDAVRLAWHDPEAGLVLRVLQKKPVKWPAAAAAVVLSADNFFNPVFGQMNDPVPIVIAGTVGSIAAYKYRMLSRQQRSQQH